MKSFLLLLVTVGLATASQIEDIADDTGQLCFLRLVNGSYSNFTFDNDGRQGVFTEGLGIGYGSMYTRDAAMTARALPQLFSSNTLYQITDHIKNYPATNIIRTVGETWLPSGVEWSYILDSSFPHKDNVYELVDLCYQQFLKCGTPTAYTNCRSTIVSGFNYIQLSNSVPWSSTNIAGFGFQEMYSTRGYNLMLGVYRYRTMKQIGDMESALGNSETAQAYYGEMPVIRATLRDNLWDSAYGMFRNASVNNTWHNSIGTAYAVIVGACDDDVACRASAALRQGIPGGTNYPAKSVVYSGGGAALNCPADEDTGGTINFLTWPPFIGWVCIAISITDPWAADELFNGYRSLYTTWNEAGNCAYVGNGLNRTVCPAPREFIEIGNEQNDASAKNYGASCLPMQYLQRRLLYDGTLHPSRVNAAALGIAF